MQQQLIGNIIMELERIIKLCTSTNNRAGYFAVLYHRVTCRISEGIQKGEFEDNARMEKLDVIFAQRYLDAWEQWQGGGDVTASWRIAFEAAANSNAIVMQHLLMGINAHINLDLGIAAAKTMEGYRLDDVQKDFNAINAILADLVDEVQHKIGKVSMLMFLADNYCRRYDEMLVCFSINKARDGAWMFAKELFLKKGREYDTCVVERDRCIALLGDKIANVKHFPFVLKLVRWFEWRQPADIIGRLSAAI